MTVQQIQNGLTVKVYETHARIALENHDLVQFNQCQHQILSLFGQNVKYAKKNHSEFTAYLILYNVLQGDKVGTLKVLKDLTNKQKQESCILHSLSVRRAYADNNYVKLFKMFKNTPNMGAYLMELFIDRIRIKALIPISKA